MSKSIYEEVIEILLNMGTEFISVPCNPIGEENSDMIHLRDVTETYETNIHEVVKALKQAQKQEKLLELYQTIDDCVEQHNMTDSILRKIELHKDISELRLKIKTLKEK